jgi:hypothetical protein
MGREYAAIDDRMAEFLAAQPVFFVATAPLAADGLLDPSTVAYLDLTGSGVETLAHLRENGRIVVMFCAFAGPPRIVRLHGRGKAVLPGDDRFDGLVDAFPSHPGIRSVVRVDVHRIADSCGYGVPVMRYERDRSQLDEWAERKGEEGIARYQADKNAVSLDGLPGLPVR